MAHVALFQSNALRASTSFDLMTQGQNKFDHNKIPTLSANHTPLWDSRVAHCSQSSLSQNMVAPEHTSFALHCSMQHGDQGVLIEAHLLTMYSSWHL